MAYARGKYAYGFCDRCGFRYPLSKLRNEVQDREPTNLYVCPVCYDKDQPQQWLGDLVLDDPKPLRNPRPDPAMKDSRRLFSWNPVGGGVTAFGSSTLALKMTGKVGQASVDTTSIAVSVSGEAGTAAIGSVTVSTS